jgi:hypothetical protein
MEKKSIIPIQKKTNTLRITERKNKEKLWTVNKNKKKQI